MVSVGAKQRRGLWAASEIHAPKIGVFLTSSILSGARRPLGVSPVADEQIRDAPAWAYGVFKRGAGLDGYDRDQSSVRSVAGGCLRRNGEAPRRARISRAQAWQRIPVPVAESRVPRMYLLRKPAGSLAFQLGDGRASQRDSTGPA